jgi:hypothetical protein
MRRLIYTTLLMIILIACNNDQKIAPYPDPLAESFRNKKLAMVVAYDRDAPSIADTLLFDDSGNIVQTKKYWRIESRSYDSLHYITRERIASETFSNYQISYSIDKEGILTQQWFPIKHQKWDFNLSDIDSANVFSVKFNLDDDGKIIKETNTKAGVYSIYKYEKTRLSRKETFSQHDNQLIENWIYAYRDNKLHKIDQIVRGKLRMQIAFSNDEFIDSVIHLNEYVIKYKYIVSSETEVK